MKCMKCRVNDANVYITTNINGNIKKECLCEECAKSINMTKFMNMDRMLSRMLDSNNRLRRLDVAMPDIANRFFKAEKEIYEEMLNDVKQINSIFDNVDNKRIDENEPEDTIRVNQDRMIIKKPMKKALISLML